MIIKERRKRLLQKSSQDQETTKGTTQLFFPRRPRHQEEVTSLASKTSGLPAKPASRSSQSQSSSPVSSLGNGRSGERFQRLIERKVFARREADS